MAICIHAGVTGGSARGSIIELMQFVGITRFNLVTSKTLGDFNVTKNLSVDQAKRKMFTPERLDAKLETFQHFCLPTYRELARREERSHGLVLVSHDLPGSVRTRLEDLCASVPRLHVVEFHDDDGIVERLAPVLTELARGDRLFTYRYDDDDLLAADFLQTVDRICATVPRGTIVSMNRGFVVARLVDDSFGVYEEHDPLNAYGLGIVSDGTAPLNIFGRTRHDRMIDPVVHETETPSWIAIRHGLNDSQSNATELNRLKALVDHRQPGSRTADLFHDRFPQLDLDALQALPRLPLYRNLDAVARRCLRHTRKVEAEVKRLKGELRTTKGELKSVRRELSALKESTSFRLVRRVAALPGARALWSLMQRGRATRQHRDSSRV